MKIIENGNDLLGFAKKVILLSTTTNEVIEASFNDIDLAITPKSTVRDIIAEYQGALCKLNQAQNEQATSSRLEEAIAVCVTPFGLVANKELPPELIQALMAGSVAAPVKMMKVPGGVSIQTPAGVSLEEILGIFANDESDEDEDFDWASELEECQCPSCLAEADESDESDEAYEPTLLAASGFVQTNDPEVNLKLMTTYQSLMAQAMSGQITMMQAYEEFQKVLKSMPGVNVSLTETRI